MIAAHEIQKVDDILSLSPEEAKRVISEIWTGKHKAAEDFNWHGLAEIAADYGRRGNKSGSEPIYEWSEIAIAIYEKLANEYRKDNSQSFMYSAMNHRSWAIRQYGAKAGDYVLDPTIIINWFYDNLKLSYEKVLQKVKEYRLLKAEQIKDFGVEVIRELSHIKSSLTPIKWLVDEGVYEPSEDLAKWLEIRKQLP